MEIMTDISASLGSYLRAGHASGGSLWDEKNPDVWVPPASASFQLQELFRLKRFDHCAQQLYLEKKPWVSLWQGSVLPAAAFLMSLLIFLFCAFLTVLLLGGFKTLALNKVYSFPQTSLGTCLVCVVRMYVTIRAMPSSMAFSSGFGTSCSSLVIPSASEEKISLVKQEI